MTDPEKLKIEYIQTEELVPYAKNAKLHPKFADVIIHRFEEFTGKPAELEEEKQNKTK